MKILDLLKVLDRSTIINIATVDPNVHINVKVGDLLNSNHPILNSYVEKIPVASLKMRAKRKSRLSKSTFTPEMVQRFGTVVIGASRAENGKYMVAILSKDGCCSEPKLMVEQLKDRTREPSRMCLGGGEENGGKNSVSYCHFKSSHGSTRFYTCYDDKSYSSWKVAYIIV